jgi:hypothetical protein
MTPKVQGKIEEIARMRVAKKTNSAIAAAMCMSYGGLSRILATPEYQAYEDAIREENNLALDVRLEKRRELMIKVEDAVPDALQVMLNSIKQTRDLRMQFAAAKEILDRDPGRTIPKQVASQATPTAQPTAPLPSPVLEKLVNESTKVNGILDRQQVPAPTAQSNPSKGLVN